MNRLRLVFLTPVLVLLSSPLAEQAVAAVALSPEEIEAHTVQHEEHAGPMLAFSPPSGLSVNRFSRYESLAFYHTAYLASEGFLDRMNWTGDTENCDEGTVSQDFHDDVLRRINYFRAMAGLNADITLDATKNAKSQKAALIMSRNNLLSHSPTNTLPCWTQDGFDAAGAANLSRGYYDYTGPPTIDGQMQDAGAGNTAVGHRRWLLFSRAQEMGNGGVPMQGTNGGASAIWVIGDFNPAPPTPVTIAWPPEGYVPHPVVYPRWSFGMSSATSNTFSAATVTMIVNGTNLPVSVIDRGALGIGDRTIVWEPVGWTGEMPAQDTTYYVTISNVIGVASSVYSYAVTVFDPYDFGLQSQVYGPTQAVIGSATEYSWDNLEGGTQHLVRVQALSTSPRMEGAEESPAPRIVDGTSTSYSLITNSFAATGSRAFHLAFPSATGQSFELEGSFFVRENATLSFKYRRRWMTPGNVLGTDISTNNGASWHRAWGVNGPPSPSWDPGWISTEVDLSSFRFEVARLRFVLEVGNSYYGATDSNYGVFIDDIALDGMNELEGAAIYPVSGLSYLFCPETEGEYLLSLATQLNGYTFPYAGYLVVNATEAPLSLLNTFVGQSGSDWIIDTQIGGGTNGLGSLVLEWAHSPTGAWQTATNAVYTPGNQRHTLPQDATATQRFFRVRSQP